MTLLTFPLRRPKLEEEEAPVPEPGWLEVLKKYQSYMKYGFLSLFLILSFMFFVKPLVRWLTEYSFGDMQLFKQLPKTVSELESEFNPVTTILYLKTRPHN